MLSRRRFLSAALPAVFGSAALRASAQSAPAPKAKPKRIRIEVSLLRPGTALGQTNAQMVMLSTEEGVETETAFLQMYTFRANKADNTVSSQTFGPKLTLTAHVEANGQIRLSGTAAFEEVTAGAAPNEPLPLSTASLSFLRTVVSGQTVTLGGTVVGKETRQFSLTATVVA